MDSDSWARLSTSSRRYQSRSDIYNLGEDYDGDEESRQEFLCPFCAEDFDIVGLCCHLDEEHAVEVKNGACPVCAKRVGIDLVGHITAQHGSLLRVQRKRRLRRGWPSSSFSILRRELRDGNIQSLIGGSSCLVPSTTTAPDPLLSSFIYSPPLVEETPNSEGLSSSEACSLEESSTIDLSNRITDETRLSDKDQEEKVRKYEFVQGLVLSTIFDDE